MVRRAPAGREVRVTAAEIDAHLYRRRGDHTRARHRGQQRHVRTRRRDTDSSASVPGRGSPGHGVGARAHIPSGPDGASDPSGPGRADSVLRRAGGGQHGDRRRSLARSARRHPSERRPTVCDSPFLRRARREAGGGPNLRSIGGETPHHVFSGGTRDAAAGCCDERGSLADTFRRRSVARRARHPSERGTIHGRRDRAR